MTSTTSTNGNLLPVIHINGENPANINVGTTYADLGAQITGPTADLNLGIHTFVDGTATDPVVIDTTIPGSHTIEYVVSDSSGLTSTSTRRVVVSAAANDNSPIAPVVATGTEATSSAQ
jgi:surface protein with Ig-like domain